MGKAASSSSSSSSISSSNHQLVISSSTASSDLTKDLPIDLRLGLGLTISATHHHHHHHHLFVREQWQPNVDVVDLDYHSSTLFIKVYMEGIPIGRKLNILAHQGYDELVKTLEHMFDTTIFWGTEMDGDGVQPERCHHVLTYEDEEGDFIMVGDVPWEMFLSTVKRLKITRVTHLGVNVRTCQWHHLIR